MPGLTWARAADMQRDAAFDGRVPGNVHAQPLYWRPPGAARGLVIVATEDNAVVALDAVTGGAVWQVSIGLRGAQPKEERHAEEEIVRPGVSRTG